MNFPSSRWRLVDFLLPGIALCVLVLFTYVRFFQVPYVGFDFNPSNGEVVEVLVGAPSEVALQPRDRLLQVNSTSWADFRTDSYQVLFSDVQAGQTVPLLVQRGDQQLTISWVLPGPKFPEILDRLLNIWLLGSIFWLFGTITVLVVWPRDIRWWLFSLFCFLTAIWLVVGDTAAWQVWGSAVLVRSVTWLCVPVFLHFHWVFPRTLGRVPKSLLWSVYTISIGLAVAEWFSLLPRSAYYIGFILAAIGSVTLLFLHFFLQPMYRRELRLLLIAVVLAMLPPIGLSITGIVKSYPHLGAGALLALPLLPVAYFYTVHRHRLGGLETRTNSLISAYTFFILLVTVLFIVVPLVDSWFVSPEAHISIAVLVALLAGILTAVVYPRFTRWVEHRLMGIKVNPTQMLEAYTERITTSLDRKTLVHVLRYEVLPSLLVRQWALISIDEQGHKPIDTADVENRQLPLEGDLPALLEHAGEYRSPSNDPLEPFPWIRLALPLEVSGRTIGLWLLGRRDPDDFYAQSEISLFETLANQTAIALVNITQARRLREFYRADIEQQETGRAALARELHDVVLNQFAAHLMKLDQHSDLLDFREYHKDVIYRIRQVVSNLRPAMLTYGLYPALEELMDNFNERVGDDVTVRVDVPQTEVRYEPEFEAHVFRIIQQACENAVQHAQAKTIRIAGSLEQDQLSLIVEDDGVGHSDARLMDFDRLLADKRYGLVGMHERAYLIGAELQIESLSGKGLRVVLSWKSGDVL
jgi:signal transduction histidine kinase